MSTEVVLSGQVRGLSEVESSRIGEALAQARSEETRRVYASQWGQWTTWVSARGISQAPADPVLVAAYLLDRAERGAKVATVRLAKTAISAYHRDAGLADPTANEGVKRVMAGLARMGARPQRQATALTSEGLAAIQATAYLPRTGPRGRRETQAQALARGTVDVAIAAVMRDGLLRRSEAAAITWADIEQAGDGSGRLTVNRSKTDQTAEGFVLYLGPVAMKALGVIRPAHLNPASPVFGLSPKQISRRIKAAAEAAGLEGAFSSHSARVGMARDLAASGCELPALMTAGRWTSSVMPARYTRAESAGRGAVARFYGATMG